MEFKEKQKFTQWWLWLILFLVAITPIACIYKQLILGEPFGDSPVSDAGLIAISIAVALPFILFVRMKLITKINRESISVQFNPFVKKSFKWSDIESWRVLNYGFVGGWGIRLFTNYGTVYNTRGKMGLALKLKNGKKYLIGTQKKEELERFLSQIGK